MRLPVVMPLLGVLLASAATTTAPTPVPPRSAPVPALDSATIRVHLLGHAIGSERYAIRCDAAGADQIVADTFEFVDRGGRGQPTSKLRLTPNFEPVHLRAAGRSYRFVNVDADVTVGGGRAVVRSLGDSTAVAVQGQIGRASCR